MWRHGLPRRCFSSIVQQPLLKKSTFSITTHNVWSDAHVYMMKKSMSLMKTRYGDEEGWDTKAREHHFHKAVKSNKWKDRVKLLPQLIGYDMYNGADVQCYQEVSDPLLLPGAANDDYSGQPKDEWASETHQFLGDVESNTPVLRNDYGVIRWKAAKFDKLGVVKHRMRGRKPALVVCLQPKDADYLLAVASLHSPLFAGRDVRELYGTFSRGLEEQIPNFAQREVVWIVAGDFNAVIDQPGSGCETLFELGFDEVSLSMPLEVQQKKKRLYPKTFCADAYGLRDEKIDHIFFKSTGTDAVTIKCKDWIVIDPDQPTIDLDLLIGMREQRMCVGDHLPLHAEFAIDSTTTQSKS